MTSEQPTAASSDLSTAASSDPRPSQPPVDPDERPTEPLPVQPQPPLVPASRRRRWRSRATYFAAGAGVVALLFAVILVVAQLGELLGRPGLGGQGSPPAGELPGSDETPDGDATPDRGQGGNCPPQTVSAPEAGSWRMATQQGDLQLSSRGSATRLLFRIYRAGNADAAAQVTAEIVPPEDVEPRFGVDRPGAGDAALVITFSDEFRASGNRFELGSVGSVSGMVLSDVESGLVAVAGIRGNGCFELGADGWAGSGSPQSTDVYVDVSR